MSAKINIPEDHPRYRSMMIRESIIEGCRSRVVAHAGLIAQGRGEAFDYLIGEATRDFAEKAVKAAAAAFLLAEYPVISVNGNAAQLCPRDLVRLSEVSGAPLEINLFYREPGREEAILRVLEDAGAEKVLGVFSSGRKPETLKQLSSDRRIVDPEGIYRADMVFVPLEDGDRTEALKASGKRVVTVDLNPLSRTPNKADVSIIDNLTRAVPLLCEAVEEIRKWDRAAIEDLYAAYSNREVLRQALLYMSENLKHLADSIAEGEV